jgi:hypothetical protein
LKYLALLLMLGVMGLYAFNLRDDDQPIARPLTALQQTGEKCLSIRDRATADIVPIIEFQRLELESRRANVLLRCMQDHRYTENPAWLTYTMPIAKANAIALNISTDEALETLKREQMTILVTDTKHPTYWIPTQPSGQTTDLPS